MQRVPGLLIFVLLTAASSGSGQVLAERQIERVFEIGGVDAPIEAAFSRAPRLAVDSRGWLYAVDPGAAEIQVFDEEGVFVQTVGGQGEGPGEFQSIGGMGLVADSLWARNFPTPRISLFTLEGEHIRTFRSDVSFGRPYSAPTGVTGLMRNGRAYATPLGNPIAAKGRAQVPIVVGSPSLEECDTIGHRVLPRGLYIPGVGSFRFAPFPAFPLFAAFPDGRGLVLVHWSDSSPGTVRIEYFSEEGLMVWERSLTFSPSRVPRELVTAVVSEGMEIAEGPVRAAQRSGTAPAEDLKDLVREGLNIPDYVPPVRNLVAGADGTIWLQTGIDSSTNRWTVLSPSGVTLFQVELPVGNDLSQATEHQIWATRTGELDVPYVIGYRIVSN